MLATLLRLTTKRKAGPTPEIELLYLVQSWGLGVLGPDPDFVTLLRLHRLALAEQAFRKWGDPKRGWRKMRRADWDWLERAGVGNK